MEKLIEELILRIEIERAQSFREIDNNGEDTEYDKTLKSIHTGKIFAFDYCVKELKRILEYNQSSISKN